MSKLKQSLVFIFRNLHLLPLLEKIVMRKQILSTKRKNKKFREQYPYENFPPLHLMYDAYAHTDYSVYMESGSKHAKLFVDIIEKHANANAVHAVVCEWGCGPLRILRHIKSDKISKLLGFDYNHETIEWCKNSCRNIEFKLNTISPPLDLEDNSIDVLYCCSIFTHLSEKQHFLWINEINRVLKTNGLFIGTFHSDEAHILLPNELAKFNNGELVVRGNVKEGSRLYVAYQSESFIKTVLLKDFRNVQKINQDVMHQTVWIAHK